MKAIYHIHKDEVSGKYYVHRNDGSEPAVELIDAAIPEAPYKKYVALLTQSDADAPVAIVLENTIGAIVWTRAGAGFYKATLLNAFTADKTFIQATPHDDGAAFKRNVLNFGITSVSEIYVNAYDNAATGSTADGALKNTSIEIRVYP